MPSLTWKSQTLLIENVDLEKVYNEAVRYRPDLQQQQKLIDANRFGVRVAQADYLPFARPRIFLWIAIFV